MEIFYGLTGLFCFDVKALDFREEAKKRIGSISDCLVLRNKQLRGYLRQFTYLIHQIFSWIDQSIVENNLQWQNLLNTKQRCQIWCPPD
jgi:hypothetical protein